MSAYIEGLNKDNFIVNIVILFAGEYFAIRKPDSGLNIKPEYEGLIKRVQVSPTKIDPLRPSSTVSSSSFSLLDRHHEVSKLFLNQSGFRLGQPVKIFIGRSYEGLDFSDYLELPEYDLKGFNKVDGGYSFKASEKKDRLDNGSFSTQSKLAVNILEGTTTITMQDVSNLPLSGFGKIGEEFISWSNIDEGNLVGVVRGEFNSIVQAHEAGSDFFLVENIISRNVIDFLLQVLISKGGGGIYDVLPEGAGISENLIDIDQFLEIKDAFFINSNFSILMYNLSSLQKFLDNELFLPYGLRLRSNKNGKIGLAVLNRNIFEIDAPIINESNSLDVPNFSIDENRISNRIRISWNYSDGRDVFLNINEFVNSDSINEFGPTKWQEYEFKGVKDFQTVQLIANLYLERFSYPRPNIEVETNNKVSFLNIGDKTEFFSSRLPTDLGNLEFASTLEVLNQAYDVASGTVKCTLAFTSFSGLRQCFIAPSSTIIKVTGPNKVTLAAGEGDNYRVGWIIALYDNNLRNYATDFRNEITEINGDEITFLNDWPVPLLENVSMLMFANYNEVSDQQKKFCFISNNNSENFETDNTSGYQIMIG